MKLLNEMGRAAILAVALYATQEAHAQTSWTLGMDCTRDWSMCDLTANECCAKLYPDDNCSLNNAGETECLVEEKTNMALWKKLRDTITSNKEILRAVANDIAFTGLKLYPSANRKVCALKSLEEDQILTSNPKYWYDV